MGKFVNLVGSLIFTMSVFAIIIVIFGYRQHPFFDTYLQIAISSLVTGLLIAVFGRMSEDLESIRVASDEQTKLLKQMLNERERAQTSPATDAGASSVTVN